MMLRPLLYLRRMFCSHAEQLLMLLHLLFEHGRLSTAQNGVSFWRLEPVCGAAAHTDLIENSSSLGVEWHDGLSASDLRVRAFVHAGLIHDRFGAAIVVGTPSFAHLMMSFSGCKRRVNKRGLKRLRQIQVLQACLAVLVALVADERMLLMLCGRRHQRACVLLLVLQHSCERGLLALWLEAAVVYKVCDWLLLLRLMRGTAPSSRRIRRL